MTEDLNWRRPRCDSSACIAVAVEPGGWRRISTAQQESTIVASEDEWHAFVAAVKRGEFDGE